MATVFHLSKRIHPVSAMSSLKVPMPIYSKTTDTIWMPMFLRHRINWQMVLNLNATVLAWTTVISMDMVPA